MQISSNQPKLKLQQQSECQRRQTSSLNRSLWPLNEGYPVRHWKTDLVRLPANILLLNKCLGDGLQNSKSIMTLNDRAASVVIRRHTQLRAALKNSLLVLNLQTKRANLFTSDMRLDFLTCSQISASLTGFVRVKTQETREAKITLSFWKTHSANLQVF